MPAETLRRSLRGSGARRRCNAIKAGPPEGGRYNTARCCTGWSAVVFCSPGRADVWRPWGFSFSCFRVCNEGKFPRAPARKTRAGRPGLQPHHPSHVVIPRPASGGWFAPECFRQRARNPSSLFGEVLRLRDRADPKPVRERACGHFAQNDNRCPGPLPESPAPTNQYASAWWLPSRPRGSLRASNRVRLEVRA
jgi:hypothetical protein